MPPGLRHAICFDTEVVHPALRKAPMPVHLLGAGAGGRLAAVQPQRFQRCGAAPGHDPRASANFGAPLPSEAPARTACWSTLRPMCAVNSTVARRPRGHSADRQPGRSQCRPADPERPRPAWRGMAQTRSSLTAPQALRCRACPNTTAPCGATALRPPASLSPCLKCWARP